MHKKHLLPKSISFLQHLFIYCFVFIADVGDSQMKRKDFNNLHLAFLQGTNNLHTEEPPHPTPSWILKEISFPPPPPNSLSAKVWQRQNLFFQNITTATTIKVCCFCCCKLNLNLHCICWICQFQKCFSRKQNQWTQFLNTIITSL